MPNSTRPLSIHWAWTGQDWEGFIASIRWMQEAADHFGVELHPKFVGGKISTLDEPHFLYWSAMCRDLGLDFAPHSGDDFGIATAIKLGLPLLIGAAVSGASLICATKEM